MDAERAKQASSSERLEEVVVGLFLTGLDWNAVLKSSLSAKSGQPNRSGRANGGCGSVVTSQQEWGISKTHGINQWISQGFRSAAGVTKAFVVSRHG